MALEDILKSIGDEAERGQFSDLLNKHASLKSYLELGEQVQPVMTTLTGMGLSAVKEIQEIPKWVDYRQKHWLNDRNMWDREASAFDENAAMKLQVADLETKVGTEMTPEEIRAMVTAEFAAKKTEFVKDLSLIDKDAFMGGINAQAQRFQEIYRTLTPLTVEHTAKYKEPIPIGEVLDYIEKTGERDPLKAYQAVIAPRNTQLEIAQLKSDVAAAEERGVQKGREAAQAAINGQRMPVDGGGGQKRPHFMSRIFAKRDAAQNQSGGRLGSGSASQAGYAEYQKKLMGAGSV